MIAPSYSLFPISDSSGRNSHYWTVSVINSSFHFPVSRQERFKITDEGPSRYVMNLFLLSDSLLSTIKVTLSFTKILFLCVNLFDLSFPPVRIAALRTTFQMIYCVLLRELKETERGSVSSVLKRGGHALIVLRRHKDNRNTADRSPHGYDAGCNHAKAVWMSLFCTCHNSQEPEAARTVNHYIINSECYTSTIIN